MFLIIIFGIYTSFQYTKKNGIRTKYVINFTFSDYITLIDVTYIKLLNEAQIALLLVCFIYFP